MLVVITMLTTAGMTVVLPILPFVVLRYVPGQSRLAVWVGILETVNALCAFQVAPLLGRVSDRFGRRPVIVLAGFGAAMGYLLFGIGGSIWVLLLGRIIQGLTAGDLPALFAYLADITPPEQRARRFGILGALSGIGTMIGPAVGGILATIDIALPVFVTAAIAAIIALLSVFLLPESLARENRTPSLQLTALHPLHVFREAFGRVELRRLMAAMIMVGLPFGFFVNNFSVLALDAIGWNATLIGLVTAAVGVVDIIIQGRSSASSCPASASAASSSAGWSRRPWGSSRSRWSLRPSPSRGYSSSARSRWPPGRGAPPRRWTACSRTRSVTTSRAGSPARRSHSAPASGSSRHCSRDFCTATSDTQLLTRWAAR